MSKNFDALVTYRMPCCFSKHKDARHEVTLGVTQDRLEYVHTECDSYTNPEEQAIFNDGNTPHCGDYRKWAINMAQGKASYDDPKISTHRFDRGAMSSARHLLDAAMDRGSNNRNRRDRALKKEKDPVVNWPLTHIVQVFSNSTFARVKQDRVSGNLTLTHTHHYDVLMDTERPSNYGQNTTLISHGSTNHGSKFCTVCRTTLGTGSYNRAERHCESAAHRTKVEEVYAAAQKAFRGVTNNKTMVRRAVKHGLFSLGTPFYQRATAGKIEAYQRFYRNDVESDIRDFLNQYQRTCSLMPGVALEKLVRNLNTQGFHKLDVARLVKANADVED